jgi:hypothetical protein
MSALSFSLDFHEVTALANRLGIDVRPEIERELETSMTRIVLKGQRQAVSTARHDTGDNRRRHTHAVQRIPGGVIGTIGTNSPHGRYVEEGRAPGKMPPPAALEGWARRHPQRGGGRQLPLKARAFLIARAIGRRGLKGDHNLRETVKGLAPFAEHELTAVGPRVIQRLVKGVR